MRSGKAIAIETGPVARPLSAPNIYLVRMGIFLLLVGFLTFILYRQLIGAFFGNPGLNGLILGVLLVGVILAIRQVARLYREVRWVNAVGRDDRSRPVKAPVLLGPMATVFGLDGTRANLSLATTRTLLDSIAVRLDENRELVRYLAGLLVFLGLLGTFWGLIETVSAVGRVIGTLRPDSAALDELKTSLAPMLSGMGVSFSASLFGLAGSLVLGFLDLQAGQAQNRFYTELEDWLVVSTDLGDRAAAPAKPGSSGAVPPELTAAINRLRDTVEASGGRSTADAVANLADGIQTLVSHMRAEHDTMRALVEAQSVQSRELKVALDHLAREPAR